LPVDARKRNYLRTSTARVIEMLVYGSDNRESVDVAARRKIRSTGR
jgi:hypothetical protein